MREIKSESVYHLILLIWISFDLVLLFQSFYTARTKLKLLQGAAHTVEIAENRKTGSITAQFEVTENRIVHVKESFWTNFRWWMKKKIFSEEKVFVYVEHLPTSESESNNRPLEGFGFSDSRNYSTFLLAIDHYGKRQHFWSIFVYPVIFLVLVCLKQFFGTGNFSADSAARLLIIYGCVRTLLIFLVL